MADVPAAIAATANSALIKIFGFGSLITFTATAIGSTYFNSVKNAVIALYPDVSRYEGPANEPAISAEIAHQMRLFQGAVHAGNAAAVAMGAVEKYEVFFGKYQKIAICGTRGEVTVVQLNGDKLTRPIGKIT